MELTKEELIKFGKRLNEWGCTVPSDILDCAANEHLQEEVAKNISSNVPVITARKYPKGVTPLIVLSLFGCLFY